MTAFQPSDDPIDTAPGNRRDDLPDRGERGNHWLWTRTGAGVGYEWKHVSTGSKVDMDSAAQTRFATATAAQVHGAAFLVSAAGYIPDPDTDPATIPGALVVTRDTTAPRSAPTHRMWRWEPVRKFYSQEASGTAEDMRALARERYTRAAAAYATGAAFVVTVYTAEPHGEPDKIDGALIVPGDQDSGKSPTTSAGLQRWTTAQVRVGDLIRHHQNGASDDVVQIDGGWCLVFDAFNQDWIPSDLYRGQTSPHIMDMIDQAFTGRGSENAVALVVSGATGLTVRRFTWFDLITVQVPA